MFQSRSCISCRRGAAERRTKIRRCSAPVPELGTERHVEAAVHPAADGAADIDVDRAFDELELQVVGRLDRHARTLAAWPPTPRYRSRIPPEGLAHARPQGDSRMA